MHQLSEHEASITAMDKCGYKRAGMQCNEEIVGQRWYEDR